MSLPEYKPDRPAVRYDLQVTDMETRRYWLWAVFSLTTLISCGRGGDEALQPADDAIRFDDRIGDWAVPWTKGVQTDDGNFADFGVFAYYSPQGSYDAAASKPDYMYNVRVTRPAGGDWTYSPTKYWPQGKVSFFAYAPEEVKTKGYISVSAASTSNPKFAYSPYDTDAAVSVSCGTGAPRVTYAVPDAVADHRDLLLSAPALDRTKEGGRVPLTFRHALAAVVFEASVDGTLSEGQSIRITGIRLGKFLHKATCHHELPDAITQTLATDAADREYALSEADGTLQGNSLVAVYPVYQPVSSATGCAMLWPQQIDDDDLLTVTVRYTSNGVTRESAIVRNIGDFVVSGSIEASKRYVFRLKFTPFGEMALTCVVQDWNQKTIDVPDFD